MTKMTSAMLATAVEQLRAGVSVPTIAARFDVASVTLRTYLRQIAMIPPARPRGVRVRARLTDAQIADAVRDYTTTDTPIRVIAQRLRVAYSTARLLLVAEGVVLRPRGGAHPRIGDSRG
jgi:hypothetical protein